MIQTQAVAGVSSLSSKSLHPQILSNKTKGATGNQEDSKKKTVASTVAHQSDQIEFHISLDLDP